MACYAARRMKLPRHAALRVAAVALVWMLVPLGVFSVNQPCTFAAVLHRPCPGCGLTRATLLLLHGDVAGSLRMHPMFVPIIACWGAIALATLVATWRDGAPWHFHRSKLGRFAVVATGVAYVALVGLWFLREEGLFGGRVPV
jgi:Protein of unknown function (DUF2752)